MSLNCNFRLNWAALNQFGFARGYSALEAIEIIKPFFKIFGLIALSMKNKMALFNEIYSR